MYDTLVAAHNGIRWLVLIAMLAAVVMAARNLKAATWSAGAIKPFVWSSILFDIQAALGIVVYLVGTNWDNSASRAFIHPVLMIGALGVWHAFISRAKRNDEPSSYRILLTGAVIALLLVAVGITSVGW